MVEIGYSHPTSQQCSPSPQGSLPDTTRARRASLPSRSRLLPFLQQCSASKNTHMLHGCCWYAQWRVDCPPMSVMYMWWGSAQCSSRTSSLSAGIVNSQRSRNLPLRSVVHGPHRKRLRPTFVLCTRVSNWD